MLNQKKYTTKLINVKTQMSPVYRVIPHQTPGAGKNICPPEIKGYNIHYQNYGDLKRQHQYYELI
jgi:hypothetical protein